jgi:lysophospholipase L1-like esterase
MTIVARVVTLSALVVVTLATAAALAVAPTHVPGAAGSLPAAGVDRHVADRYVALGDSFTAGPLIPQVVPALGCVRSTHDYPALVGARLAVRSVADVSCSGADTTDLRRPQATGFAVVPPQLSALSPATDLVTLGIGGNDFGVYRRLVTVCPRVRFLDPGGAPCRAHFRAPGGDRLLAALERTGARLDRAVARIRSRAPQARVLVVGYPRIAPARGTCPDVLPFADGDYRYADLVERRLNAELRRAARGNQAEFVNTYAASRGHDACAGADAWVNGQRTDVGRALAYHPFRAYMDAVARLVTTRLG